MNCLVRLIWTVFDVQQKPTLKNKWIKNIQPECWHFKYHHILEHSQPEKLKSVLKLQIIIELQWIWWCMIAFEVICHFQVSFLGVMPSSSSVLFFKPLLNLHNDIIYIVYMAILYIYIYIDKYIYIYIYILFHFIPLWCHFTIFGQENAQNMRR